MEPEDFDMKAKNANDETIPAFENEAWDKMELLLDKHLPQKKEKKRFLIWWFTALIPVALIAGYFLINHTNNNTKQPAKQGSTINEINNNPTLIPKPAAKLKINGTNQNKANVAEANSRDRNEATNETNQLNLNDKDNSKTAFAKPANNLPHNKDDMRTTTRNNLNPSLKNKPENNGTAFSPLSNIATIVKGKQLETNNKEKSQSLSNNLITDKEKDKHASNQTTSVVDIKENNKNAPAPTDTTITTRENNTVKNNINTIAKKKKAKSNFYLTITFGLEANGTTLNNLGALKPVYGAGVQYSAGKLFLRTGVLVTKKMYAAKDNDYNRKPGTWMSAVTFDNIDASCKVIEIPLSIGYTIKSNKKTGVFITAGTSSYFMKKEDYQFYFKNQSGNDTTRHSTFINNSNHYFSSISLSAGIEQKVTKRLSIIAEPTIKIPINGIGFGKVKIYGTGILITAKLKLR